MNVRAKSISGDLTLGDGGGAITLGRVTALPPWLSYAFGPLK